MVSFAKVPQDVFRNSHRIRGPAGPSKNFRRGKSLGGGGGHLGLSQLSPILTIIFAHFSLFFKQYNSSEYSDLA